MRRPLLAANWKMNSSKSKNATWLASFLRTASTFSHLDWVVFPPFLYLEQLSIALSTTSNVFLGAQNMSQFESGAYTGEVASSMLEEFNCRFVLVGHSERRSLFGETNAIVAEKFFQAKRHGLRPILCVGETLAERQAKKTASVIAEQLSAVMMDDNAAVFEDAVIAYEPVWAIGTGEAATPAQADCVHQTIRETIAKSDQALADRLPILYGGSVNAKNAAELFSMPNIDGGLVGGASLSASEFLEIGKCINS